MHKIKENIPANTAFYLPVVPSMDTLAEPPFLRLRTHTWHYGLSSRFQAPSYSHMVCHILSQHEFLHLGCFLQSAERHERQDQRAIISYTNRQTDRRIVKRQVQLFSDLLPFLTRGLKIQGLVEKYFLKIVNTNQSYGSKWPQIGSRFKIYNYISVQKKMKCYDSSLCVYITIQCVFVLRLYCIMFIKD